MSAHSATLTIVGASYNTALGSTSLSISPSSSQLSFPSFGEAEKTLTITGLPNYVAKGSLGIDFTLIGNGGGTSLYAGVGTILYLTDASPMGIQNPVWRDVLDDACEWAIGEAGAEDCRLASTAGLHNSYSFYYESAQPIYTVPSPDGWPVQYYRLQHLFEARSTYPYQTNADCSDINNYLMITFNALGISGAPRRHFRSDAGPFQTHLVKGLGHIGLMNFMFNYHQTGGSSLNVYDAAAAHTLDLSGSAYNAAPAGWPEAGYWQTDHPNPPPGGSNFLGLVWRPKGSVLPEGEQVSRVTFPISLVGYVVEN